MYYYIIDTNVEKGPKMRTKRKKRPVAPIVLMTAGAALLAVMLWIILGQLNSPENQTVTQAPPTNNIPYPNIQRVSLADSYKAYEQGSAIFVDVRSEQSYTEGHIPGSISLPADKVETQFQTLDPAKWIITYCT